ncbi:nucleotide-binding universal stress UspA family protein [Granulicella aggregans]|uniref:Nucleotide-binding universal stress UspA family protein n=1 Tax=Granulicella aggregans TaxID=474949 RepID=A0A7W8E859_9BACT|nr:universal stress protein [Granulicella aggregans]MBB5060950.1 nucleotide-binding universal stress UspA family protein [Granulicella aggregans]
MQLRIPRSAFPVKKILLATDFSAAADAAFQESLLLCAQFSASLYILNVFDYSSSAPPESGGLFIDLANFREEAKLSLERLIYTARQSGVSCDGTVTTGLAHATILNTMTSQSCDLVVLGTRAIRGFERLVFGSTAEAVLRNAARPVFTVGPQGGKNRAVRLARDGVVVFATDFHVATTEAIAYAALFARTLNLPLHCIHVLPRSLDEDKPELPIVQIITKALQHLTTDINRQNDQPPVCAITYGSEISNSVVEYARKHDARLIVLGVRRASFAASHVPAHIAYRIIAEADCPVLTVAFPLEPRPIKATIAQEALPEAVSVLSLTG